MFEREGDVADWTSFDGDEMEIARFRCVLPSNVGGGWIARARMAADVRGEFGLWAMVRAGEICAIIESGSGHYTASRHREG